MANLHHKNLRSWSFAVSLSFSLCKRNTSKDGVHSQLCQTQKLRNALQGSELNLLSSLPFPLPPMPLPCPPPPPLIVFSLTFLPIVHNLLKARNLGLTLAVVLEDSAVVADIEGLIVAFEGIGGLEWRWGTKGDRGSQGGGTESGRSAVLGWMAVGLEGAEGVVVVAVGGIRVCCKC